MKGISISIFEGHLYFKKIKIKEEGRKEDGARREVRRRKKIQKKKRKKNKICQKQKEQPPIIISLRFLGAKF